MNAPKFPPLAGNEFTELYGFRKERYAAGPPAQIVFHDRLQTDARSRFAMALIERWGLIMAAENGEDSAGRQKGRRMTPDEVVDYALDCASKTFEKLQERGWLIKAPSLDEVIDRVKDQENVND